MTCRERVKSSSSAVTSSRRRARSAIIVCAARSITRRPRAESAGPTALPAAVGWGVWPLEMRGSRKADGAIVEAGGCGGAARGAAGKLQPHYRPAAHWRGLTRANAQAILSVGLEGRGPSSDSTGMGEGAGGEAGGLGARQPRSWGGGGEAGRRAEGQRRRAASSRRNGVATGTGAAARQEEGPKKKKLLPCGAEGAEIHGANALKFRRKPASKVLKTNGHEGELKERIAEQEEKERGEKEDEDEGAENKEKKGLRGRKGGQRI
eukprot:GHVT01077768.1.p1 GENE.GHVT01077768.1~~GHVT01077768.1.p1  ORF type:complete len:264 (-),score=51.56 GHVT01077768.1:93-884(-)